MGGLTRRNAGYRVDVLVSFALPNVDEPAVRLWCAGVARSILMLQEEEV